MAARRAPVCRRIVQIKLSRPLCISRNSSKKATELSPLPFPPCPAGLYGKAAGTLTGRGYPPKF